MVASTDVAFPDPGGLVAAVNRVTRKDENVFVDALGLGEALFGDHMAANMILLGAAYQAGAIPVRAAAIEEAIAINGVQVEMNTQAFRVGRLLVADPGWVGTVERTRAGAVAAHARARARGAGPGRLRGGQRRAAAAARGPGPRADRLPGRGVRAPLRRLRPDGRRGGAGGGAGRDAARRGGGALPLQADGLQGRVRGGAAPPPARGPGVDPGGARARPRCATSSTRRSSGRSA